jgi:glucan phosphoethanolaminetransferase (alkaline phosphatase superfamily)
MNFKVTNVIYSLISLIVALFFIFIGIVSCMLPWFPGVRLALTNFILENSIMIFLFGFCFMIVGIAYIAGIFWGSRRHYYNVKSGPYSVNISETIFHDYLDSYWKQIFPNTQVPCTVKLSRNKVHVTADLPFVPLGEQKDLIEKMQQDVTEIFTRILGYRAEYLFSVSFNEE